MTKDKLIGLITELTGASKDDSTTKFAVSTFWALKELADFDAEPARERSEPARMVEASPPPPDTDSPGRMPVKVAEDVNFAVSYTINLNLPETTNPEVLEAEVRRVEERLEVDLGHRRTAERAKDNSYYPQFRERLREEAAEMASHYAIFYCLENSIRELIIQRLEEVHGPIWWVLQFQMLSVKTRKRTEEERLQPELLRGQLISLITAILENLEKS